MSITIRAYNVLFGDCLLVSWDEDDGEHHAWIDFGNFLNDKNEAFELAYDDVLRHIPKRNGKRTLDLVVVTHRHLDHLEGFHSLRRRFKSDFIIKKLWYAHVTPSLESQFKIVDQRIRRLMPTATLVGDGPVGRVYRNNFGLAALSTQKRMNDIEDSFPCRKKDQHAVHRLSKRSQIMPPGLSRLRIDVLAPERNSRAYLQPLQEAIRVRQALDTFLKGASRKGGSKKRVDPLGVSGGVLAEKSPLIRLADFARLRRKLQTGGMDLLAAVDKTRNNTSIVLALTYDGRRLLLTGDAEEKSWELMQKRKSGRELLESDLIKVAHHGSHNASPDGIFSTVLPTRSQSNAVIISTDPTRYPSERFTNEVPKAEVLDGWRKRITKSKRRSRLKRTDKVDPGKAVKITFR